MPRILVVDDDEANRDMLKVRLSLEGHEVLEAADGEEGLRLAQERLPDLVILDAMMPKLDGWSACRLLKNDPRTRRIPVVMLTARGQRIEELRGWEAGADEYVTKPYDHHELTALVAKLVSGGAPR